MAQSRAASRSLLVLALAMYAMLMMAEMAMARPKSPPPHKSNSFLKLSDLPSTATGTGKAKVLHSFSYKTALGAGLQTFNPFLTTASRDMVPNGAACANKTASLMCWETPGLWSSAAILAKKDSQGALRFMGLTDRGPNNGACPSGIGFSVPQFAPSFVDVAFDKSTMTTKLKGSCYLKDMKGKPITGLPNSLYNRDAPYGPLCENVTAERYGSFFATGGYDKRGLDPEAIVPIPGSDGLCIASEEYGPSVFVVDCNFGKKSCGTVHVRYVPKGHDLVTLGVDGAYKIVDNLPAALLNKRPNRGFENIAVSPSGKTAFVHLQSSMGLYAFDPNVTATRNSHIFMVVRMDISKPLAAKATGLFAYLGDRMDATNQSMWVRSTRPDINKLSETVWITKEAGAPAEAPVMLVLERATAQVKVYVTDYSKATNLLDRYNAPGADPLMLDSLWAKGYDDGKAKLDAMGVVPAHKGLLIDTGNVADRGAAAKVEGWTGTEKQEAVLPMNKCTIAMGDDNDFGVEAGPGYMHFIQLGRCIDEVYRGMQQAPM